MTEEEARNNGGARGEDFRFITFCDDEEEAVRRKVRVKVFGVGGAGGNAVNRMINSGLTGVDFVAVNTDNQDLEKSLAPVRVPIGQRDTCGLGTGGDPERGQKAAIDDTDSLMKHIEGADMIFIAAGMGGGTGTGAAPILARLSANAGALTVAVVTKPFEWEGKQRFDNSAYGLQQLTGAAATLIAIPNDNLLTTLPEDVSLEDAFKAADDVLRQGVQGISDLVTRPGTINLDFQDVRSILSAGGRAVMGVGIASGKDRGSVAAQKAANNPLLENASIEGARSILINVAGGKSISLNDFKTACASVKEKAHPDVNVISGTSTEDSLGDNIKVTVVAAAFDNEKPISQKSVVNGGVVVGPFNAKASTAPTKQASPDSPDFLRGKAEREMLFSADEFIPTPPPRNEKDYEGYQTPSFFRNKKKRD